MLNAGSSRVFNCNDTARKLVHEQAKDPYFFKSARMHALVLLKEAIALDRAQRAANGQVVATKLYFPYNAEDVYEGGRSVYFHDPKLMNVLAEQFGLAATGTPDENLLYDVKILRILDQLPSLDGFLMRDALELEGIIANEHYFEVSEAERFAIHEYIRRKFEPLVRAAFGGQTPGSQKVTQLIDKIWEAKDKDALEPLIKAFRFPEPEALAIFASWKGINYYTFEYARAKQKRESFGLWLRDRAVPRNVATKDVMDHLNQLRKETIQRLRYHWMAVDSISQEYETLYARFVSTREGASGFVDFLKRSREIYWRMGDSLSKINHAINCWEISTANFSERKLPWDKLEYALDLFRQVLAGDEKRETAVVWKTA